MANRIGTRGRSIDLFVRFVDATGEAINSDETPEVQITDSNGNVQQAFTNLGVSLLKDTGLYQLTYTIPEDGPDGYYIDTWKANIGTEQVISAFQFLVISAGGVEESVSPTYEPGDASPFNFTKEETLGINKLLRIVKIRVKNDGVRKVPDGAGGYTEEACTVFSNDELICFLVNSLSEFNSYPHFTNYNFDDERIQTIFSDLIIQGAVILALAAQALIEKGREFVITDNGISFQPPAVADLLNNQYSAQLADYKEKLKVIKNNLKPSPLGLGGFRVTAVSPNYLRLRHLRERAII
mgnify:CR=1 FL=1